jgi:O-methyltransferase
VKKFGNPMKKLIKKILGIKKPPPPINNNLSDFTLEEWEIFNTVKPYTMTSIERVKALLDAINYVSGNNISGDLVECGVWKGGSIMAALLQLKKLKEKRAVWLYDTFEGMSKPSENDIDNKGQLAANRLLVEDKYSSNVWAYSTLDEVKNNLNSITDHYCDMSFIKGKVEETLILQNNLPEKISVLRLDTDWYESTKVELEILFPKLSKGGILLIDDYGHWKGCKKAVDEYFENIKKPIFLSRIDYTGRLLIKTWE